MASLYYGGVASFWDDWMEFTATAQPVLVQRSPRLVLVARSFDARTASALDFLLQNNLPVQVLEVAFYIDASGRRILDVEWEAEPESSAPLAVTAVLVDAAERVDFRGITLAQVAAAVNAPCELRWDRPRKGTAHTATLLEPGSIVLPDSSEHRSPSGAAMAAAEVAS